MISHYTWGSMTTLYDFGSVMGHPLDTFLGVLTNSWSRLLAHVWSGPKLGPVYTMDHGRWPFFHSPTWWSNFHGVISFKKQLTKPLGPSLCINQTWAKRNDHAPKNECVNFYLFFFLTRPKRQFWGKKVRPIFCRLLSSSSLLFP